MNMITESILIESSSARNSQLMEISHDKAEDLLSKVKALYFALWKGTKIITTEQLAEFYEVDDPALLRKVLNRHKSELHSDGVKTLRGKELRDVRDIMTRTSKVANLTIWTPRSALRLGMLLRDSSVAQAVRSSLLDMVEKVVPAQAQEIERLRLENQNLAYQLELAKIQERLMLTTQAIATMHGTDMVALVLGKPDAVITKVEHIENLVTVDRKGKAIAKYDGLGITFLSKRYGFGKNTKACRAWLESIGIHDNQWLSEPSLVTAKKLPRELLPWLDKQYGTKQGVRQRLIGE